MTFNEILKMIHNACIETFDGDKGRKEIVIQCATQIYIAQMGKNEVKE